ncbi:NfeD-like partner-binding protein [Aneurinibacillus soli]|uniref:Putative membrane protein YuaF n=1 Tax=Aneurinibacillus soli TaxID=1500254 RepID=A0A0U4NCM5_9BACL|nr:NfeD family protein [Aneurinibacillus soli]PYE59318.1 NfeD-like partner-binding protein [Aneurinibacillus soli]BAU26692.1 putative membrane protein YuaF [Aneurinibacillus soli]
MITLYMGCLVAGVLFAVVMLLFGDWLDGIVDSLHVIQPTSLIVGLTVFGGAGVMLLRYTEMGSEAVCMASILLAIFSAFFMYFLYVRPMQNAENSTGFSIQDLAGRVGDVLTPIPAGGYGEVLVRFGAGNVAHTAAGLNGEAIEEGARVLVIEARDGTLYVIHYDEI